MLDLLSPDFGSIRKVQGGYLGTTSVLACLRDDTVWPSTHGIRREDCCVTGARYVGTLGRNDGTPILRHPMIDLGRSPCSGHMHAVMRLEFAVGTSTNGVGSRMHTFSIYCNKHDTSRPERKQDRDLQRGLGNTILLLWRIRNVISP